MKLVIAALMGLSLAQDIDTSNVSYAPSTSGIQIVEDSSIRGEEVPTQTEVDQDHFWAYSDMMMGVMIGFYVPLIRYTRNEDCYAKFWEVAASQIEYSNYFDGQPLSSKISLGMSLSFDALSFYQLFDTCMVQF